MTFRRCARRRPLEAGRASCSRDEFSKPLAVTKVDRKAGDPGDLTNASEIAKSLRGCPVQVGTDHDAPRSRLGQHWRNLSRSGLWVAAITTVVVLTLGAVLEPALLGGVVPAVLVVLWWYRVLQRNLQGYTGDCLGAAQQLAELGLFLGMLAAWYI